MSRISRYRKNLATYLSMRMVELNCAASIYINSSLVASICFARIICGCMALISLIIFKAFKLAMFAWIYSTSLVSNLLGSFVSKDSNLSLVMFLLQVSALSIVLNYVQVKNSLGQDFPIPLVFVAFLIYYTLRIPLVQKIFLSGISKLVIMFVVVCFMFYISAKSSGFIGERFGVSSSLLFYSTIAYKFTYAAEIILDHYKSITSSLCLLFLISLFIEREFDWWDFIGSIVNIFVLVIFVSAYCADQKERDYPFVNSVAYKYDFSFHHCRNISKNLKVLFTGDNGAVIVMNSSYQIDAFTCKQPRALKVTEKTGRGRNVRIDLLKFTRDMDSSPNR